MELGSGQKRLEMAGGPRRRPVEGREAQWWLNEMVGVRRKTGGSRRGAMFA